MASSQAVPREPRPFVGRAQELAMLVDAWTRARNGAGSVWLLVGEPGIGKSRLAEELARIAEGGGAWLSFGRAWESGGAPALWPWTQALRGLLRRSDDDDVAAKRRELLAPLLPELAGSDGSAGAEPSPEAARFRLLDAVVGALLDLAERAPLCVVLEDLHVADHASLLLLELLAPQVRSAPLLVIGTHRELAGGSHADDLARLARIACTLPLGPLARSDVADYLVRVHEQVPEQAWIDSVSQRSGGNPLLLVELGRQRDEGNAGVVPANVRAAVRQRIAGAGPAARGLVELAAVLGRELSLAVLAAGLGLARAETIALLGELAAVGVLERIDDDVLRFSHALVRDAIYAGLDPEPRAQLHARAAEATLRAGGHDEPPWSTLAHHLLRAPDSQRDRAIEAAVCAADGASARYAFADAAEWLRRALVHHDEGVDLDPLRRIELLIMLGRASILAGEVATGRAWCTRAADAARVRGASVLLARAALEYGAAFVIAEVDEVLVGLLREAEAAIPAAELGLRARVIARLAAALQPAIDPERPIAMAREAVALARSHGDDATLLDVLRSAGSALADLGDPRERRALDGEHLALAQRMGDVAETVRAAFRATFDALELGELADARALLAIADRGAERLGAPDALWRAALIRGALETCAGDREAFERARHHAVVLGEQARDPNAARCLALQAVVAPWWFGRTDEALVALPAALAAMTTVEREAGYGDLLHDLLHGLCGRDAPHRFARTSLLHGLEMPDTSMWILAAELVLLRRDDELARRLVGRLEPHVERIGNFGMSGAIATAPIGLWHGRLLALLGEHERAKMELERAWAIATRAGAAIARLRIARALAELGDDANTWRARVRELDAGAEPEPTAARSASQLPHALELRRIGDVWELLRAPGPVVHVRDTKGMAMLAALVAVPRRAFHVLELVGEHDHGDAGPLIDVDARDAYRARLLELDEALGEADRWNDVARAERLAAEREALQTELARAVGLGGRLRRAGSTSERARVNVQRRLKDVVRRVTAVHAELGRHLEQALRTGTYCSYEP